MAELSLKTVLTYSKNNASVARSISSQFVVSASPLSQGVQNIPTTDATLDLNAIGTIGYVYVRNLDATNYIIIGSDGSAYPLKLKAGEWAVFRWNAAAIHVKANTAACDVEYSAFSD